MTDQYAGPTVDGSQTQTLADFLLARIAEDEKAARDTSGPWMVDERHETCPSGCVQANHPGREHGMDIYPHVASGVAPGDAAHIARWDPARVLAECEAKRRLVVRYVTNQAETARTEAEHHAWKAAGGSEDEEPDPAIYTPPAKWTATTSVWERRGLEVAVQILATAYADHTDYREEWRV